MLTDGGTSVLTIIYAELFIGEMNKPSLIVFFFFKFAVLCYLTNVRPKKNSQYKQTSLMQSRNTRGASTERLLQCETVKALVNAQSHMHLN